MRSGTWLASLALLASASATEAAPMAYAVSFDTLYQLDLATGAASRIGAIGYNDVEGLAIGPDGTLYGASDANKTLIMIDKRTGRGVAVGGTNGNLGLTGQGLGQFDAMDFGLTFSCDGKLWLSSDATRKFWEVDPATGSARFVGNLGVQITGLGARGDGVYGFGSNGDESLYHIDLTTGQALVTGPLHNGSVIADGGLDADEEGNLWGVLDYRPPQDNKPSDIVRIDHRTGLSTRISTTLTEMEGLAIAPVRPCGPDPDPRGPGPVSIPSLQDLGLALLGSLMALLGFLAIDRRRA